MSIPTTARAATTLVKQTLTGIDGIRTVHTDWCTDALSTTVHLTTDADGPHVLTFLAGAFEDVEVKGYLASRFIGIGFPRPSR